MAAPVRANRFGSPGRVLAVAVGLVTAAAGYASVGAAGAAPLPTCETGANGALFVTETCTDPEFTQPFIDTDEQRTTTDPATNITVSYRYIHGGFTDTTARFSFYFPPATQYRGRFFEPTYPTLGQEDILQNPESLGGGPGTLAFALSNGAYVVLSNNGGGVQNEPTLGGYRVNAATAKYSRVVAEQVYGQIDRPRGYLFGGSGGAYQTLGAAESTSGVWDGFVPMVPGVPNAIPNFQAAQVLGLRVLKDKLPQIADAMEPGGSGDPFAGLDAEQRQVLQEITRLGFPLRGWWQYQALNGGSFFAVQGGIRTVDPTYVDDFWTQPGYEGTNPQSSVQAARIQYDTTVTDVVGTPPNGVVLSNVPSGDLFGADLVLTSGTASGKSVVIGNVSGNTVHFVEGSDPTVTSAIRPGDNVRIDNSWFLALQYYFRYQVPTPDQYGWNQFRDAQGVPIYPQRPLVGSIFAGVSGGAVATGQFHGKMIMLASVMDVQAFPWSADWYRRQAEAAFGPALDDNYRLWYSDNADHDPLGPGVTSAPNAAAHIVGYLGEMQQALLDLDAWVSQGTRPPGGTNYTVDANTQVQLAENAGHRRGVQPVVSLSVQPCAEHSDHAGHCFGGGSRSDERADVAVGQPVSFSVRAQVPPRAGEIVRVEWDFEGLGNYPVRAELGHIARSVHLDETHTFTEPGTYFPVVRVTSQRDGNPDTPFTLIQNLGRVRVVVH